MTYPWQNDEEMYELIRRELFTAVVGDVLDQMGLTRQFLPQRIQPLREDMVVVGRAMTVLEADVYETIGSNPRDAAMMMSQPFGLMLDALDDLKAGEVYICAGASPRYALWGELMSTRARALGAVGAVVEGYSRDTRGILAMDFPTFSFGRYAQDQGPRGKVIDFRCPIVMNNGVTVNDGDLLFGDWEGVLVIPREVEQEAIRRAAEKARTEKKVMTAIGNGMSARQAWDTYGVL